MLRAVTTTAGGTGVFGNGWSRRATPRVIDPFYVDSNWKDSMAAGAAEMGLPEEAAHSALSLDTAEAALNELNQLAPLEKARLVKGLFAAVTADGTIRIIEAELMRLVGAVLDCPLPPLIHELDPAALAP